VRRDGQSDRSLWRAEASSRRRGAVPVVIREGVRAEVAIAEPRDPLPEVACGEEQVPNATARAGGYRSVERLRVASLRSTVLRAGLRRVEALARDDVDHAGDGIR